MGIGDNSSEVFAARWAGDGVNDPLIALARERFGEEPTYLIESAEGVTTFPGDTVSAHPGREQAVRKHRIKFLNAPEIPEETSADSEQAQPTDTSGEGRDSNAGHSASM